MNNISNAGKWFLKLIFLFLSFIFAVIVIFLFRPEYFIDDIEIFIKDQISSSTNGEINIGNHVAIANGATIISETQNFSETDKFIKDQGITKKPISIEDDVWLGSKVTILGNTRIGKGAVIGAGSVVTKDIPSYTIAYGVPCKVVRNRK